MTRLFTVALILVLAPGCSRLYTLILSNGTGSAVQMCNTSMDPAECVPVPAQQTGRLVLKANIPLDRWRFAVDGKTYQFSYQDLSSLSPCHASATAKCEIAMQLGPDGLIHLTDSASVVSPDSIRSQPSPFPLSPDA